MGIHFLGCEMKYLQEQMDYDQKRLTATRAMHQPKPCGSEHRTPAQIWSGLGFSSSMPENVIREKLAAEEAANKVKVAVGGNLQGINEKTNACHGEQAADGWFRNSSSASKANTSDAILPTDDLPTLFSKQGLAKYTDLFVRHEVDLQTFATLTEQDLRDIGVPAFGARKKLLLLANKVKQTQEC